MKQVTMWEASDGSLYVTKQACSKKERSLLKIFRLEEETKKIRTARQLIINQMYELRDFRSIENFLLNNWEFFAQNTKWAEKPKGKLLSVIFKGMIFGACSNSHSAPIGKETNCWRYKSPHVLTGYLGWEGRVSFCYDSEPNHSPISGICTGSGGGGGSCGENGCKYHLSYDVKIWKDDFPNMFDNMVLNPITNSLNKYYSTIFTDCNSWGQFWIEIDNLVNLKNVDKNIKTDFCYVADESAAPPARRDWNTLRKKFITKINNELEHPYGALVIDKKAFKFSSSDSWNLGSYGVVTKTIEDALLGQLSGYFSPDAKIYQL